MLTDNGQRTTDAGRRTPEDWPIRIAHLALLGLAKEQFTFSVCFVQQKATDLSFGFFLKKPACTEYMNQFSGKATL